MPVSLFYHYYDEPNPQTLADWVRTHCERRSLRGRIRIATQGINATVSGSSEENLREFETTLESRINTTADPIDYKRSPGDATAFPSLSIRIVTELVTLGASNQVSWKQAAPALTPEKFLSEIQSSEDSADSNNSESSNSVVLFDARNMYETNIGHFKSAIVPNTRAFADLPKYFQENKDLFRNKRVLMYCTGGIRCETASALLASFDVAESIGQLSGGIHRFLERYPDGAQKFVGKNLVFDSREAIAPDNHVVVGKCIVCSLPWDNYSQRNMRCASCRCRVLICSDRCEELFTQCQECSEKPTMLKKKKNRRKRKVRPLDNNVNENLVRA